MGGGLLDDCGGQVSVDLECLVEFSMVVRGVCCGLSKLQHWGFGCPDFVIKQVLKLQTCQRPAPSALNRGCGRSLRRRRLQCHWHVHCLSGRQAGCD